MYDGMHVNLNVSGWANQLYLGSQHAGNYDKNSSYEQQQLRNRINRYANNGTYPLRPVRELRLIFKMDRGDVIRDMMEGEFRNCHVKYRVSGWANQLYIGSTFAGNYDADSSSKQRELKNRIIKLVLNGTCEYRY